MLGFIAQYFYQSKPPDEDSNEESASPPVVVESKPKSANPVKPESPTSHSSLAEVNFPSGSVSGSQSALVQRLNQVCANISGRIQCDLRFNWWNLSVVTLLVGVIFPTMTYPLFAVCRLVLGTLYPAYASYKAVRTKNVREYVKWMMYWIVFALFTTFESIGDLFIAFWFPFYYELKIVLLLWLISPVSRGSLGSSMLYRKLVHPNLLKREDEIDRMLGKLQEQGYNTAIRFGSQAFQYVTNLVMTTAIRGGGGLVTQLKKSYSLADLANLDDTDPTRQRDGSSSYPRALGYQGDEDPYFFRERSQSRESQGMGSRESSHYEPMYISNSPMRHPTRRQISEGYGSPSMEPSQEATRRKPGTPPVKESLLAHPPSSRHKRPKSLALSQSRLNTSREPEYLGSCQDLSRGKSLANLPQKSKTPSPRKVARHPQASGTYSTLPRKNKSHGATNPTNPAVKRRSQSNRSLSSNVTDSKHSSTPAEEFSEDYLLSFSSAESDDDHHLYS